MLKFLNHYFMFIYIIRVFSAEEVGDQGRLFRNAYTSTVIKENVVTSLVPSSCVRVEATLPPCRNVRNLRFPKLPAVTFNNPAEQKVISNWKKKPTEEVHTTPLGWGEYFGFYAPTVTVTTTNLRVTTVEDPSVVVTFAIKGCRPMRLPLDLNRCPQEYADSAPRENSMRIEDMLVTSSIASPVVLTEAFLPTRTMSAVNPTGTFDGLSNLPENPSFQDNSNLLEPSHEGAADNGPANPTETLSRT